MPYESIGHTKGRLGSFASGLGDFGQPGFQSAQAILAEQQAAEKQAAAFFASACGQWPHDRAGRIA